MNSLMRHQWLVHEKLYLGLGPSADIPNGLTPMSVPPEKGKSMD